MSSFKIPTVDLFFREKFSFYALKAHTHSNFHDKFIYIFLYFNSSEHPFYLLLIVSIKEITFQEVLPCENMAETGSVYTTKDADMCTVEGCSKETNKRVLTRTSRDK